jgi:hypothetical protein
MNRDFAQLAGSFDSPRVGGQPEAAWIAQIDLYQIHWPAWHGARENASPDSIEDAVSALAEMQRQGKIRDFIAKFPKWGFARVRGYADHRSQPVQRATMSRSGDRDGDPMVFALSTGLRACVWIAYRRRASGECQLHLALGASLRTGVDQALPAAFGASEQELPCKGAREVSLSGRRFYRADDFLLTAKRNAVSARRFFHKMLSCSAHPIPRVINVDKNPSYPAAVRALKQDGELPQRVRLRQCKFLNHVTEQDHRTVKKRTWLAKGYNTFHREAVRSRRLTLTTVHHLNSSQVLFSSKLRNGTPLRAAEPLAAECRQQRRISQPANSRCWPTCRE